MDLPGGLVVAVQLAAGGQRAGGGQRARGGGRHVGRGGQQGGGQRGARARVPQRQPVHVEGGAAARQRQPHVLAAVRAQRLQAAGDAGQLVYLLNGDFSRRILLASR